MFRNSKSNGEGDLLKRKKRTDAIIFAVFAVFLFAAIQTARMEPNIQKNGVEFIGTDTYMRMVRAQELYDGGSWYDSTIERNNFPYGDELHWTRLMDLLIIGEAKIIEPVTGIERAFELSGLTVSLVIGGFSILAMLWASSYMFEWSLTPIAIILFLSQYFALQYFAIGRPDHHSLIILFFISFFACAFRLVGKEKKRLWGFASAVAAAMAFWVSVETVFMPAVLALVLTLSWVIRGDDSMERLRIFSTTFAVLVGIFILVERPFADIMVVEYDKISIPYLFLFSAMTLFAWGGSLVKNSLKRQRIAYTIASGGGLLCLVLYFYPEMTKGPFAGVNPAIVPVWLSKVVEVQNIFAISLGNAILYFGLPVVAATGLAYFFAKGKIVKPTAWGMVALGLSTYMLLGMYQIRWIAYAQILSVFPAVLIVKQVFARIEKMKSLKLQVLARGLTIAVLCLSFLALDYIIMEKETNMGESDEAESSLKEVCEWMDDRYQGAELVVLADVDCGPEILYRTKMSVISSPYHRNDEGILFYYDIMDEVDMEKAKSMMKSRFVKIILLDPPLQYNDNGSGRNALKKRLIDGKAPDWIKEVKFPEAIKGYRIYETSY